ncbi:probable plastid-lipid-associated protein 11, chloroplastic isoform X2 [Gastrolobium bilobum]|uniref:probable plastid-lipid-associated protein 11, chloroplastic isoform X2 n=1 Tax=Gastrolobium bilobum TaxID=150636 RepID=UPI002AAF1E9B|nr:probable plastid-lipid-associated protein 11, chloroplastic isoform X2 [Gastrolobium bilobum]
MATSTTLFLPNPFKSQKNLSTKFPNPRNCNPVPRFICSSVTAQSRYARENLLALISDQDRGLRTQNDPAKRASIVEAIDAMAALGAGSVTTGDSLSGTWRLLWTTEKEQLFIVGKAHLFGTSAGDVLQVIDVRKSTLNNVITFPPDGVFFVRSSIQIVSPQRVNFSCSKSLSIIGGLDLQRFSDLLVQYYVGRTGKYRCHRLDRVGLRLCTSMITFEL